MRHLLLAIAALALASPVAAQTISKSQTGAVGTVITCTDTSGNTGKCVLPMATPVTAAGVPIGTASSPQVVTGSGTAGTAAAGVVSVQGIASMTPLLTTANGTGASADQVQGTAADGAAAVGNPVQTGGVDHAGNAQAVAMNTTGGIATAYRDGTSGPTGVTQISGMVTQGETATRPVATAPYYFTGSVWEKDFACDSSAVVSVTAGATTEIVALSGSTIVRVCSVAISMSAAGTAQFVYGTGANCGTGTTSLTGAIPLATATPLALSAGAGSLFRGAAANALCVAAVTGNVVGVISYARY